jgi:putative ABC transport system substrate-binding protein
MRHQRQGYPVIDRRTFVLATISGFLAQSSLAHAQQPNRAFRLGWLSGGSIEANKTLVQCFLNEMRQLGWTDGRDFVIEYRWTEGVANKFPVMAKELAALKPDLLVATSTPGAQAVKAAAGNIPVVFLAVSDPVASGLVSSLARPSGNISGVSNFLPATSGKLLELLKSVAPQASRIGVLGNPSNGGNEIGFRELDTAGRSMGVAIVAMKISKSSDINDAFATMKQTPVDGLVTLWDGVTLTARRLIADEAMKHRLPTIFQVREFVEAGGLMSYGLNACDNYQAAAKYVDKILRGAKPADLPVQQPTNFELVINLKTARALGLTIPKELLLTADEVIR